MTETHGTAWTLGRLLEALRRFWLVIAALTLLGGAGAFAVSASTTPVFKSTATLYFVLSQGGSGTDLNQGSTYTQNQMLSFAQLATSSRVVEPVVERLDLGVGVHDLTRRISVTVPQDTVILQIEVSDTSPQRAAAIANALADSLTEVVDAIAPQSGQTQAPTVRAETIDAAVVPRAQSAPDKPRDTLMGALLGLILGLAGALVVTVLDTRIRTAAAVESAVDAPLLSTLPRATAGGADNLPVAREPLGVVAEDLRRLRSALEFANVAQQTRRLLITSALPREGKSTVSCNLALVLAERGTRVLIIDADLRRPQVDQRFGVEGAVGLTSVLAGEVDLPTAVIARHGTSLHILTSGAIPPNPAELLASSAMHHLLTDASAQYDYVIVDSPPVLSAADANVLAAAVDGVILIVDSSRTRRSTVRNARRLLGSAGARVLGVVLNRAGKHKRRLTYYAPIEVAEDGGRRRSARAQSPVSADVSAS